jgi:hypothetical protein
MSLAVVVAQSVPIEHGFWITLAALLVLHSSAASTSATVLQAIVGTVLGFLIAAGILFAFQTNTVVLWILLPICLFISGYVPGVVSFLAGQVAFTCLVVVLFTLIDPSGITTAVLRVETVALGAISGGVMAFILWPRGARVALAQTVAAVYRTSAESIRNLATSSGSVDRKEASSAMHGVRRHAEEAFAIALTERGRRIDLPAWMTLFRAPNMVHSLVSGLWKPPTPWLSENCGDAVSATFKHRDAVAGALVQVADRLDPPDKDADDAKGANQADGLTSALTACINCARPLGLEKIDNARLLVALNDWLSYIEEYVAAVEPDLNNVIEASRPGAWLHWSLPKLRKRQTPAMSVALDRLGARSGDNHSFHTVGTDL